MFYQHSDRSLKFTRNILFQKIFIHLFCLCKGHGLDKFDPFWALWGISFDVEEKEIVTLIGPNGAGKTTTLKTITGLLKPFAGEIGFEGQAIGLAQILKITVGNVLPMVADLPGDYIATYTLVPRYYLFLVLAVIMVAIVYWISNSKLGLGMMAVREDEEAAKASGVNTFRQKMTALAISSFFAGLAGGAFAFYHVSYYHDLPFSPTWTFDALLITYVGGVGTIVGPIIGAFFYAIFKELFVRTFPQLHVFIFGVLFILVVLLLPGGLVEMAARVRRFVTSKKTVTRAY